MPTKDELRILQAYPLEMKVRRTQQRIREWVDYYGVGGVYVSFSGGKDSTVLLHIVRELYPDIEAVFVSTGLEYPEIQKFAQSFDNVTVLRPKMSFKDVITKYGYPFIGKAVAHSVSIARNNPDGFVMKNVFSQEKCGKYSFYKWLPLTKVDFKISDSCCDVIKKSPTKKIEQNAYFGNFGRRKFIKER